MKAFRSLLGRGYLAIVVFRLNAWIGRIWLAFYQFVYPNLTVGESPRVWGRFEMMLYPGGRISIGDRFHLVSSPSRSTITLYSRGSLTVFPTGRIEIADDVGLNGTAITSKKCVRIGAGTMIAANVVIVDSDFHAQWPPEARSLSATDADDREVVIGRNVWIGLNTTILKGVAIGDNSIIGAGSVVASSIPANVVAAGNPARVLRPINSSVREAL